MDIWRWVETTTKALRRAGSDRLAELLDALPGLVCDEEDARVEALVPEALALARAERLPWVEVFIRHWHLQSRAFHRHDVSECLHEATSLLEFASREETRGCPQSVCVTQDFAGCFGRIDGPGYVEERLAAARETLARIDPSWPCYACISAEYADALNDAGRYEESVAFVRGQNAAATAAGIDRSEALAQTEAEPLIRLGRFEEALERLGDADEAISTRILRARALVGIEAYAEAAAELPAFETIAGAPYRYEGWVRATLGLVRGGLVDNDLALGRRLREIYARLDTNGALSGACQHAIIAAEMAAARGSWRIAALALGDARRLAAQLRVPPPLPELTRPSATANDDDAPVDADALLATLDPSGDPEAALEVIGRARARAPDDVALVSAEARALRAAGYGAHALASITALIDREGGSPEALVEATRLLLEVGDPAGARIYAERLREFDEPRALWILASAHEAAGDVDAAIATLRALIELGPGPDPDPALARLADLLRSHQRFAEAAAYRRRLVERDPAGPHAWALMSEAAIAGEWSWVREVAARLDLSLDPGDQGPLDYPFGRCKIRFDEGGADLWGERRGPVSARVLSIVGPRKRERYRDLVVLDTTDLREPSETSSSDQRRPDVPIFRALATIERAEWRSFTVDGPNPGEAEIDLLRSIVRTLDGELSDRTNPKRRLRDREAADPDTKALPAFYAFIAVSPSVDLVELDFCLEALVDTFERPLAWTELAHALPPGPARDAALERNERIVERFGL